MASVRYGFREVVESGQILVIRTGLGRDDVGLVVWDGNDGFIVWFTFDGRTWERVGSYQFDADDWREAQERAAHRLAFLLADYQA